MLRPAISIKPAFIALLLGAFLTPAAPEIAHADAKLADTAISAFAKYCTQPRQKLYRIMLRMERHAKEAGYASLPFDVEFYDTTLERATIPITPGTNRRCVVTFDGSYAQQAKNAVLAFVERAKFGFETDIPKTHSDARVSGTELFIARRLQSGPKAVLHVGTSRGANGVQTFINVERLPR
ncbi:MAG: hypothetical protein AAF429_09400 [Pseudomonadota bacterium]